MKETNKDNQTELLNELLRNHTGARHVKGIKSSSIKGWLEIIKNLVEIVAIIVVGFWTYNMFIRKDASSLEARAGLNGKISAVNTKVDNICLETFDTFIKNIGTTSFDIIKVQVKGWEFDHANQIGQSINYLDFNEIQKKENPFFDQTYTDKTSVPFVDHYSPDAENHHTFQWFLTRRPDKSILFRIDFYIKGEENQPKWYIIRWLPVCNAPLLSM